MDCKKCKGELHSGHGNNNEGGNTGSNKKCNFCSLKGYKEAECYKKFPEKAPAWYKEKATKTEAASSSIEVSLTSLVPGKLGDDMPAEKGDDALAILRQEDVWICDTGASTHVTRYNVGAKSIRDMMVYSLGHSAQVSVS